VKEECLKGKLVVDFVYSPPKTVLIKRAEGRGMESVDGVRILVWQALESERIWFNGSLKHENFILEKDYELLNNRQG